MKEKACPHGCFLDGNDAYIADIPKTNELKLISQETAVANANRI